MRRKKSGTMIGLFLGGVILMSGCSGPGGYGRLVGKSPDRPGMTIERLLKDWQKYHVYYAGDVEAFPTAVLFDPKEDGKTLVADKWTKVTNAKTLSDRISWMRDQVQSHPFLWEILGPGDRFYGYFYSPRNRATIKVIDDHTLYMYDIPYPLEWRERGPSFFRE